MKFNYLLVTEWTMKFNFRKLLTKTQYYVRTVGSNSNVESANSANSANTANRETFRIVTNDHTRTLVRLRKISIRTLGDIPVINYSNGINEFLISNLTTIYSSCCFLDFHSSNLPQSIVIFYSVLYILIDPTV